MPPPPHLQGRGMRNDYPSDYQLSPQFLNLIMQRISSASSKVDDDEIELAIELDSHADSPVVGRVSKIISRKGKSVFISGFIDKIGKPIKVPVVDASVVYTCNAMGKSFGMILRNSLHVPEMDACLLNLTMMH